MNPHKRLVKLLNWDFDITEQTNVLALNAAIRWRQRVKQVEAFSCCGRGSAGLAGTFSRSDQTDRRFGPYHSNGYARCGCGDGKSTQGAVEGAKPPMLRVLRCLRSVTFRNRLAELIQGIFSTEQQATSANGVAGEY